MEIKHGTLHAYKGHKCRCSKCRDANRFYSQKRRKQKEAEGYCSTCTVRQATAGYATCSVCRERQLDYYHSRR